MNPNTAFKSKNKNNIECINVQCPYCNNIQKGPEYLARVHGIVAKCSSCGMRFMTIYNCVRTE